MQFITGLFGDSGNTYLTALFALGAIILLILLVAWLLKFVLNVSTGTVRGRNRRLSVVDSLVLDQKRQLLIVRRDDVEHLILTGGPQDVVVETGIAVAEAPPAQATRRPLPFVGGRRPQPTVQDNKPGQFTPPSPAAAIEKLKDTPPSRTGSGAKSLRHTGLLRPVANTEDASAGYKPDISDVAQPDSGKESVDASANQGETLDDRTTNDATRP